MAGEHPFDQPAKQPHLGHRPHVGQKPVNLVKQLAKHGVSVVRKFVMILFGFMVFILIVYPNKWKAQGMKWRQLVLFRARIGKVGGWRPAAPGPHYETRELSEAFSAGGHNTRYRCVHGSIRHAAR